MPLKVIHLALSVVSGATAFAQEARTDAAIVSVTVVDVERGRSIENQTVLIRDRRIAAMGPAGATAVPPGVRVIDGRGKFLLPGLWDMHVHTTVPGGEPLLAMYPVFGVTGVRDMNDSFPQIQGWRQRIASGELIGPRIVAAGPYLVGGRPPIPHLMTTTAEQGRAGVDSLRRLGVDFVKVHNGIPRDAYFAIAKRVKELGWTFAGHVPQSITVAEAADAGQRSLEHLTGLPNACTAVDSAALRPTGLVTFLLGPCTSADLGPTIERLKVNGTAIDPTLTVFGNLTGEPSPVDSMDKYLSPGLRQLQSVVMRIPAMSPEAQATATQLLGKRRELVGRLYQAGIPILTGSDAPTPGTFPGISLHEEFEELVASGIPPAAVVAAATIGAARYLGLADSLGTVAVGRRADLVLLEGDPLRDIRNTRRIAAVWIDGRWLGDAERRQIFVRAEAAARGQ